MTRNHDMDAVSSVILQEKADVICLQEISGVNTVDTLKKKLQFIYYPSLAYFQVYENKLMIISRYSISQSNERSPFQSVYIKIHGHNIHVLNLLAPRGIFTYKTQLAFFTKLLNNGTKYKEPTIIVGDFNTTEASDIYEMFNKYFMNAHYESGSGFGFTFPTKNRRLGKYFFSPFVRIDHIFYNAFFESTKANVIEQSGGSSHFPIISNLFFK